MTTHIVTQTDRLADRYSREIFDLRVFVVGGGFQYIKMFHDAGLLGARSVDDANVICFTGGSDVSPSYYEEKAIGGVYCDKRRDDYEAGLYREALDLKKPMVGICRGAQFLNVMNGGKLWQDVNNHTKKHSLVDFKTGEDIAVTSTHHQQMIPSDDAEILAMACESTTKRAMGRFIQRESPQIDDVEVVFYPDSLSLCFQPHPEFSVGSCQDYFLRLFDDYIMPAC